MAKQIAVYVGPSGEAATLYEQGKILLYQKQQGAWHVHSELPFTLNQELGLRGMRGQMAEAIGFIGECKVFVASAITGVPYFELEKAGCSVWEFSGKPLEFLDFVMEKEEEAAQEKPPEVLSLPVAEDLGNGYFRISIKEVQEAAAGATSKQALLPTLRRGGFYQLEVICNHIPPWLEAEVLTENMTMVSEKIGPGMVRAIISKKLCGE